MFGAGRVIAVVYDHIQQVLYWNEYIVYESKSSQGYTSKIRGYSFRTNTTVDVYTEVPNIRVKQPANQGRVFRGILTQCLVL